MQKGLYFDRITKMTETYLPILLGLLASANVLFGGSLVIYLKKYFNIILGFAGGVMLSVVTLNIIPEIMELHEQLNFPLEIALYSILFGLLGFHLISFFFPLHEHGHHEDHTHHNHTNHLKKSSGIYGAIFMIIHSFIDGFGIGAGFLLSTELGLAISVAVIMHNFSDGINTTATLIHSQASSKLFKILFGLNILAPLTGVLASMFLELNEYFVFIYLGLFSGSILYLAISDILPHAHSEKHKISPIIATLVGILFVIFISGFFGGHSH